MSTILTPNFLRVLPQWVDYPKDAVVIIFTSALGGVPRRPISAARFGALRTIGSSLGMAFTSTT